MSKQKCSCENSKLSTILKFVNAKRKTTGIKNNTKSWSFQILVNWFSYYES